MLKDSNGVKSDANSLFAHAAYSEAIQFYDKALGLCPSHLDYEIAVLKSNIAACHLMLREWKEAVDAATVSIESLERLVPTLKQDRPNSDGQPPHMSENASMSAPDRSKAVIAEVDDETAARIDAFAKSGRSEDQVHKIRSKALSRRARARENMGGWSSLQGADEGRA